MTAEGAIEYASASSERAIDLERRLAVCCGRVMACRFCTTAAMGFDRTPQIVVAIEKGRVLPPQRRAETCTGARTDKTDQNYRTSPTDRRYLVLASCGCCGMMDVASVSQKKKKSRDRSMHLFTA